MRDGSRQPESIDIDSALMLRVKGGDTDAFDALIKKYQRPVFNMAFRFLGNAEDAEEVAQEVFLRLYRSAPGYRPLAKLTTYIFTITKNLCFNIIRDRKGVAVMSIDDEDVPELPDPAESHLSRMEKEDMRQLVAGAVQSLPETVRMAVILSKYHGLSYNEIAEVLGCSVTAVKLRIFRAKELLVKVIGPELKDKT